jgi:5-formyltetrahydrofolate cyclo-ligase
MIIGAVGVDRHGVRIGKGAGEADLVYALGRDRGFLGTTTPVAVLIHDLQLLEEPAAPEATDLPVDLIITPKGARAVRSLHIRPKGLDPAMITPDRLEAFPGLRGILQREGIELPSNHS